MESEPEVGLQTLSKDVLTAIFRSCDSAALINLLVVCKRFRAVILADFVTRRLLQTWVFADNHQHVVKSKSGCFRKLLFPTTDVPRFAASFVLHKPKVVEGSSRTRESMVDESERGLIHLQAHFCVGLLGANEEVYSLNKLVLAYFAGFFLPPVVFVINHSALFRWRLLDFWFSCQIRKRIWAWISTLQLQLRGCRHK